MSELESEVERFELDYAEAPIDVLPKESIPIRFDGIHFNLIENQIKKIPLWIAKILEKLDKVEIVEKKGDSFKLLKHLAQEQDTQYNLVELDDLTYRHIIHDLQSLQQDRDSTSLLRAKSIQSNFQKLIGKRTEKIIDLVRNDTNIKNAILTSEEQWLYQQMNEIFNQWRDNIGENIDYLAEVEVESTTEIEFIHDYVLKNNKFEPLTIKLKPNQGNTTDTDKVPLFLVDYLRREGLVDLKTRLVENPRSLIKIERDEKKDKIILQRLDPLLYHFIKAEIKQLLENGSEEAVLWARTYESRLNYIVRLRARKILQSIYRDDTKPMNMTPDEKILYDQIKLIYNQWLEMFSNGE